MPAQLTTRAQVNGYRFLLRRLDHALIRRDVRMLHDPMRSQLRSLVAGAILALLIVAGAAIMAFLRPQGAIGDANIVMGKDSGALYVVVRDNNTKNITALHPVLNLASARLITGSNESPTSVNDRKLDSAPRGPILGLPGAPGALPASKQSERSDWTLCDTVQLSKSGSAISSPGVVTTMVAGRPHLNAVIREAAPAAALLVSRGDKTYLIYDGKRAEIDTKNTAVARTLRLSEYQPRAVSTGLLDAAREVPVLTPPNIPLAGQPGPGRLSEVPIGGVIKVSTAEGDALYVVQAGGVQRISPFTAQVIRNANSQGMSEIKSMPPDILDGMATVSGLPINEFPDEIPTILTGEDAPVACLSWTKTKAIPTKAPDATEAPADRAVVTLLAGTRLPLPDSAKAVTVATSDGTGDRIDGAYIPPSSGEFIQITGISSGSPRRGSLFYVADNGIRYGIPDLDTAEVLGLGRTPKLAPWEIVGQLVPGATLSKQAALTKYDSLPTGS
ncbi:type VII secretion protein EccB [Nocardia sp. NPDC003979]